MEVIIGLCITLGILAVLVYICFAFVALSLGAADREFSYDNSFPPILAFWYDMTYDIDARADKWSDRNDARHDARLAAKANK